MRLNDFILTMINNDDHLHSLGNWRGKQVTDNGYDRQNHTLTLSIIIDVHHYDYLNRFSIFNLKREVKNLLWIKIEKYYFKNVFPSFVLQFKNLFF